MSGFKVWIVLATGYRQGYSQVTGMELLWRKLRALKSDKVCILTPQEWNQDPAAMAEFIVRNSNGTPSVFFAGYSYGVGNYFIKFARALQDYGIKIDSAVLCDGVKRFRLAKVFSMQWFNSLFSILIPGNVRKVRAFRQREDRWLRGHYLRIAARWTSLSLTFLEGYDHCSIDEAPQFHRAALTGAQQVIEEAGL